MSGEALLALAARAEAATGPSLTLDALITIALDPERQAIVDHEPGRFPRKAIYGPITEFVEMAEENGQDAAQYLGAPAYTASLDAAMSLVPEGLALSVSRHGKRGDDCEAYVGKSDSDARGNFMTHTKHGNGKTPALALTAAALRARATP